MGYIVKQGLASEVWLLVDAVSVLVLQGVWKKSLLLVRGTRVVLGSAASFIIVLGDF